MAFCHTIKDENMTKLKQANYHTGIRRVRGFLISGVLFFSLVSHFLELNYPSLTLFMGAIVAIIISTAFLNKQSTNFWITLGLVFDGLFIFFFTSLVGGTHNPFAMFFLIQVIFAAQCLSLKLTWFFSFYAIFLYSMLFFIEYVKHSGHSHHGHLDAHLLGMLISFALICILITYFIAKTSEYIKKIERQSKDDERLVMLGAFAAQAAHQISTPLSSIDLLVERVKKSISKNDFDLIKNELKRCKMLIQELADQTEQNKATSGGKYKLNDYLQDTVNIWMNRTNLKITLDFQGDFNSAIILDKTLQYALFNLFDNSYQANAKNVFIDVIEKMNSYQISIKDDGPGFNELVLNHQYKGLGLYLTEATLKKMNGSMSLSNREDGGAEVIINLPGQYYE